LIESANQKVVSTPPPSAQLYPDFPSEPYTNATMNKIFKSEKDLRKSIYYWRFWQFKIKGKNYEVLLVTPIHRYKEDLINNPNLFRKAMESISDSSPAKCTDLISMYEPPYITAFIAPNHNMTPKSRTILTLASLPTGIGFPAFIFPTYDIKFKRKTASVELKKSDKILQSFSEGQVYFDNSIFPTFYSSVLKTNILDKNTYYKIARYDYKYFDTPDELYFEIKSKDKQDVEKIIIPEKIKAKIKADMKPYEDYVKK
jgi:hypothetical protein